MSSASNGLKIASKTSEIHKTLNNKTKRFSKISGNSKKNHPIELTGTLEVKRPPIFLLNLSQNPPLFQSQIEDSSQILANRSETISYNTMSRRVHSQYKPFIRNERQFSLKCNSTHFPLKLHLFCKVVYSISMSCQHEYYAMGSVDSKNRTCKPSFACSSNVKRHE